MTGILWEVGIGEFLLVTIFLGGGAAYMSGRSVALTWRPFYTVFIYSAGLNCAVRFIHYALFGGTLLSIQYFIVDFIILAAIASFAFRITKTTQMIGQYSWLYERQSLLSWRHRPAANDVSRAS
jgi:hypothetical protein